MNIESISSGELKIQLSVINIVEGTSVDGTGLRTSIYFAGCNHCCKGCHNPQSWDINNGHLMTISEILQVVEENDFNVTFTGGDPLVQLEKIIPLARAIKEDLGKTIWCYTGYTWGQIIADTKYMPLLQYIDIVVDGPFIESLRDISLLFRGSSNQRLIEVQKILASL